MNTTEGIAWMGKCLPGTIPMNAAASNPVDSSAISHVNLFARRQHHLPPDRLLKAHPQIRRDRGQPRESGREHDTDIPDIDGEIQPVQDVVDDARGDHEAREDSRSDGPAERVPCCRVEPVPEFLERRGRASACVGVDG